MVDAVDLPTDEDADPAVAPLAPVGQQEGNQQSQTCKHKHMFSLNPSFLFCTVLKYNFYVLVVNYFPLLYSILLFHCVSPFYSTTFI